MVKVSIKFLSEFKNVVGMECVEVNVNEESTVEDLLKHLCDQFKEPLCNLIFESKASIKRNIVIFINGKNIATLDGLKTKLRDGDQIILSTPVAGG